MMRTSTKSLSCTFAEIEGSANGADSEDDLKGLFDDLDVNSSKLGPTVAKRNEKLVKLFDAIGDLPLTRGGFSDKSIDLFGDAYEYLMQMYASTVRASRAGNITRRRRCRNCRTDHRGRQGCDQQSL